MPYSVEQLQRALELLREEKPKLKKRRLKTDNLEGYLKYELRARDPNACPTTWIDEDASGDFNPESEKPQPARKATRSSKRIASLNAAGPSEPTPTPSSSRAQVHETPSATKNAGRSLATRVNEPLPPRIPGESLTVSFKFTHPAARLFLIVLSQPKIEGRAPKNKNAPKKQTKNGTTTALTRTTIETPESTNTPPPYVDEQTSETPNGFGNGTRGLLSLPPGDPATRGCKFCWQFDHICTLLDDADEYPCHACSQHNVDCELIIPPIRKRRCEACTKNERECTFDEVLPGYDHGESCIQCMVHNEKCVAGPARDKGKGVSRETGVQETMPFMSPPRSELIFEPNAEDDVFLDRLPPFNPAPHPDMETTLSTAFLNLPAPLPDTQNIPNPLLNGFTDHPQASNPEPQPSEPQKSKLSSGNPFAQSMQLHIPGDPEAIILDVPSRPSSPPIDPDSIPVWGSIIPNISAVQSRARPRTGPIQRTIRTSFAHPMDFTHVPPADGSRPCHFCQHFTYGIIGLGMLTVQVIDHQNGKGYTEVSGGHHVSHGSEPSRMCTTCATQRARAIDCVRHVMVPIPGLNQDDFDTDAALSSLLPDPATGRCVQRNPWCAICVSPAFFVCEEECLPSFEEDIGERNTATERPCCGLLLCASCARVMAENDGDLARTIEGVKNGPGPVELRADTEFLDSKGPLYRTYEMRFA